MNFSENLQTLRKAKGISQEQLAEMLDVSRQAVSKWETDGGYPEIDKIIALCGIFGCTMDELITGVVSVDKDKDKLRLKRDRHYNRFSKQTATGVLLILLGIASNTLITTSGNYMPENVYMLATAVMLVFIAIAVFLFVTGGISHSAYENNTGRLPELYTPEETEHFNTRVFPYLIGGGVIAIFLGIICTIISSMFEVENIGSALFLALVGVGCWMFIYGGIQHSKYDVRKFNENQGREARLEEGPDDADTPEIARLKKREVLSRKLCAIIMLFSTIVFLFIGFGFNIWHPTWAVFPIGGLVCAIVNEIFDKE